MLTAQWEVSLTNIPPATVDAIKTTVDHCNALGEITDRARADVAWRSFADRLRIFRVTLSVSLSRKGDEISIHHKRTIIATVRPQMQTEKS